MDSIAGTGSCPTADGGDIDRARIRTGSRRQAHEAKVHGRMSTGQTKPSVVSHDLLRARLTAWRQTESTRIPDSSTGGKFIDVVGMATLYPVSSEIPNLYHAYMGDPNAATDSRHDSPSGHVYTWRWELGGRGAAFYSSIVRKRPTWVSWELLPAALRLFAEPRTPDELWDLGVISKEAYQVAHALDGSDQPLTTAELRRAADFPTGKDQRAAYLKAIEELETRLLLAKVFMGDGTEMGHALVANRYRKQSEEADRLSHEEALDRFLSQYLPHAVYIEPFTLARHLKLPEDRLLPALERLVRSGEAHRLDHSEEKLPLYAWN